MSNPVKNAEIEDVLSSIRRLVSENGAGQGAAKASAPAADPAEPTAQDHAARITKDARSAADNAEDRLVLTEALRVPEGKPMFDTSPIPTAAPAAHVPDSPLARELRDDMAQLRDDLPSFLQRRPEAEAETPVAETPVVDALSAEAVDADAQVPDADVQEMADEPADALGALKFETARDDVSIVLKDTLTDKSPLQDDEPRPWEGNGELLSEWHSVRADAPDVLEPDEPGDGDYAGTVGEALPWEDHTDDHNADHTGSVGDVEDVSGAKVARAETTAEAVRETPELHVLDAGQFAQPEAEDAADVGAETSVFEDVSAAKIAREDLELEAAPYDEHVDEADDIGLNAAQEAITDAVIEGVAETQSVEDDPQYEAVLDEEMLRDLVGEIVRQELMGPLGERITRNVRKLVRREINRALSARSLNGDY